MLNGSSPSLADIAAVTGNDRNGGSWDDGNGWWVLIILFALFGGWGGNWGNNGGGNSGTDSEVQRGFDTQGIMTKLDGISNGLCSMSYDQLGQMNGINQAITNTGYQLQNAIQQDTIAGMQQANALQAQLSDCCCENREAIAQVRYDMATQNCAITNAINNQTRDIVDNTNANYRAMHDELVAMQIAAKDDRIAEQNQIITQLNLSASQAAQNAYLVDQLKPAPVPSYPVPNPWAGMFGMHSAH